MKGYQIHTNIIDITKRKTAEKALHEAYEDLERRTAERTLELESTAEKLKNRQEELLRNKSELEKVNSFVKKAFPRKDDRNEIIFDLTQSEVRKLIALMQVRITLDPKGNKIPEPSAQIPVLRGL